MVEQADARKRHCYAVLIARLDNMVVAYRASCLRYIFHAALVRTLDIVAEREESIGAQCNPFQGIQPGTLLLTGQHFRLFREELLPNAVGKHIVVILADVDIDSVIAVGTANFLHPRQTQHLRMLAQVPDIRLVPRQAVQ